MNLTQKQKKKAGIQKKSYPFKRRSSGGMVNALKEKSVVIGGKRKRELETGVTTHNDSERSKPIFMLPVGDWKGMMEE
ncbi:TonB-dependent receptor [Sesbania bispinosa]|nr:TonB-dependent receptor [Sesbania bispinosa]